MTAKTPVGAYKTETGFAAYDKNGLTWPVAGSEAAELETDRKNRNANNHKTHSGDDLT